MIFVIITSILFVMVKYFMIKSLKSQRKRGPEKWSSGRGKSVC